jgi:hypothetical protein
MNYIPQVSLFSIMFIKPRERNRLRPSWSWPTISKPTKWVFDKLTSLFDGLGQATYPDPLMIAVATFTKEPIHQRIVTSWHGVSRTNDRRLLLYPSASCDKDKLSTHHRPLYYNRSHCHDKSYIPLLNVNTDLRGDYAHKLHRR